MQQFEKNLEKNFTKDLTIQDGLLHTFREMRKMKLQTREREREREQEKRVEESEWEWMEREIK